MNSPYGSFDFDNQEEWSWLHDHGWTNAPLTDGDRYTDDDISLSTSANYPSFPSGSGSFVWPDFTGSPVVPDQIYHGQQYDVDQSQYIWPPSDGQPVRSPTMPIIYSKTQHDLSYTSHNGRSPPMPPPAAGHPVTAADQCTYPRHHPADHHAVPPTFLQSLFPSLPSRANPPSTHDDTGQLLQKQTPKFAGDLYTALWIRGEGTERAGWCGFCCKWYKLKDSAYWYHLHYSHGISCATGQPLDRPRELRWRPATSGYEALCGNCAEWVSIGKGQKVCTTYFRHAYKCATKGTGKVKSPRADTATAALL